MGAFEAAILRQPNLPRWICHIRQRLLESRVSLLTGAGVSMSAGAPSWSALVEKLAVSIPGFEATFERHKKAAVPDTMISQYIYSRYIDEYVRDHEDVPDPYKQLTAHIGWHQSIRAAIYEAVPNGAEEIAKLHPYITNLAKLCLRCDSTITFNFDDILDQVAAQVLPEDALPPKTTWSLPPIDKVNFPFIFHINGLLPQNERKKTSDKLVFTEDSFLQVLYGSTAINNNVMSRFANNTFLLVGVSLTDHSLKSILATTAVKSPGSVHYIVNWIRADDDITPQQMEDISRANFDLYNLVTVFLTSEQIDEFLRLIQVGVDRNIKANIELLDEKFRDEIRKYSTEPICYKYYIAGPVASGKSTLLENLRTFQTLEEWPERTPSELYQDHKLLTDDQRKSVDQWVYRQLRIKNRHFVKGEPGIHVMDRAPLDLFAFSLSDDENRKKAKEISSVVEADRKLSEGEVMLVVASPDILLERQLRRGRIPKGKGGISYDGEGLKQQTEQLEKTYKGAVIYKTDICSQHMLTRKAIRHILFEEYRPLNISALNEIVAAECADVAEV